jgi:3-oxoadipate enol-lactonase
VLRNWDVRGRLGAVGVPTLALAGSDDPSAPPEEVRAIADEVPGARYAVLDDARHLANVERAREFNAELMSFL